LKDCREVDAVTLVGRLFRACATVTRNDRSPMVLSRVRGTIRRGQEPDRNRVSKINGTLVKVTCSFLVTIKIQMFHQPS